MRFSEALNLFEEVKPMKSGKRLVISDIDDCILKADGSMIGIWKEEPGKSPVRLSSDEYAKDPDAATHKEWFNYKEFNDPVKVRNSIIKGTPILSTLRMIDAHIRAGDDFAFLTARGLQDVVTQALQDFLKVKDKNGNFRELGKEFKKGLSAAVNDKLKIYPGVGDPEKKANVLKNLCSKYDEVIFIDDDMKNVNSAKALKLDNLRVIHASGVSRNNEILSRGK